MRGVRSSALIIAALVLAAPLAIAQTAVPQAATQSAFSAELANARATFRMAPLPGPISVGYGSERHGKAVSPGDALRNFHDVAFHRGADYAAAEGATIVAPGAGRVLRVETSASEGTWLEIDHGQGLLTRYTHLSAVKVNVGDTVVAGQDIAEVGHTGAVRDAAHPHLHFEVLSTQVEPGHERFIDPAAVLPRG